VMMMMRSAQYADLLNMCRSASHLVVLTGAGLSTESGIPDYRSPAGSYSKGHVPMQHDEFLGSDAARVRYWSRSMRGWQPFASRRPNAGHHSLSMLEQAGILQTLITQNVDGLHSKAGSQNVLELHGSSHCVRCLGCGAVEERARYQSRLVALNYWSLRRGVTREADLRADGDAEVQLSAEDAAAFRVPSCRRCGGTMKPDVTFFGDVVPAALSRRAMDAVLQADALLIAGTTLSTLSAFRLAEAAAREGAALGVLNLGPTRLKRAPGVPHLKVESACGETLARLAEDLIGVRSA